MLSNAFIYLQIFLCQAGVNWLVLGLQPVLDHSNNSNLDDKCETVESVIQTSPMMMMMLSGCWRHRRQRCHPSLARCLLAKLKLPPACYIIGTTHCHSVEVGQDCLRQCLYRFYCNILHRPKRLMNFSVSRSSVNAIKFGSNQPVFFLRLCQIAMSGL